MSKIIVLCLLAGSIAALLAYVARSYWTLKQTNEVMQQVFSKEKVKQLIDSPAVLFNGSTGLQLSIDGVDIAIKKPYIDSDGGAMGNSIFIDKNDGLVVSIRLEPVQANDELFVLYRENERQKFTSVTPDSPAHVRDFLTKLWPKITQQVIAQQTLYDTVWAAYKQQFSAYQMPVELEGLFRFEQQHEYDYAESFGLAKKIAGASWGVDDKKFIDAFIEFAGANGSGSFYAFWLLSTDLNKCPIVVFGDEGGVHVVAENLQQLMHLLSYDVEISVDHKHAYFFKDDDPDEDDEANTSTYKASYAHWLLHHFKLAPIQTNEQANAIIAAAGKKHQAKLNEFLKQFGIDNSR
jgi:hypothetical protein